MTKIYPKCAYHETKPNCAFRRGIWCTQKQVDCPKVDEVENKGSGV